MSHRGWGYRHLEHLDVHRTGNGGSQASARGPIPVASMLSPSRSNLPPKKWHTRPILQWPQAHTAPCSFMVIVPVLWPCGVHVLWRATAKAPRFRQGKIPPPSVKTNPSHEIIPRPLCTPPVPPCSTPASGGQL